MKRNKNILFGSRAYLAGNLENSAESELGWREKVQAKLETMGVQVLDPVNTAFINQPLETPGQILKVKKWRAKGKFKKVRKHMQKVVQKDLRMIDLSDFVIFNYNIAVPTFGTPHELVVSIQQKKPIFLCVGDKLQTPLWFLGSIKDKYIYNNVAEVVAILRAIDSGEVKIDSSRWKLLDHKGRNRV